MEESVEALGVLMPTLEFEVLEVIPDAAVTIALFLVTEELKVSALLLEGTLYEGPVTSPDLGLDNECERLSGVVMHGSVVTKVSSVVTVEIIPALLVTTAVEVLIEVNTVVLSN